MDTELLARVPVRMKVFIEKGTIAAPSLWSSGTARWRAWRPLAFRIESKQPMKTDTIFRIASMTKPFIAVGIMILMEEGRVALSDSVEKYLSDFKNMWVIESREGDKNGDTRRTLRRPSRLITLRDLLTHTSACTACRPGRSTKPSCARREPWPTL